MKVAVIGCTHAGTAAVINIAKLYPEANITVYERNDNISFLSCGIALYVGGVIENPEKLFYSSPEALADLGAETKMQHEVMDVNLDDQVIKVKNLEAEEVFEDNFDKIILTTGSWPIIPNIPNMALENILLSKNWNHSNTIIERAKLAENIAVIGAGYIGVELAESFEMMGKNVTLVDAADRIMPKYLDKEFTDYAEKAFTDKGIHLALGQSVQSFEGEEGKVTKVITDKGTIEADLVIMCVGFRPNTELFKDQVAMLPNGAIVVDEYMRTSRENVFAAGDSCAVIYNPTGDSRYIPLATNAVRMGTLVARNLKGPTTRYLGTQGTSGIKIYDHCIASTGLTEAAAIEAGKEVETAMLVDNYRPEFMPTTDEATIKVVYEKDSHKLLGAQLICSQDLTQVINTMSVCIQNEMTVEELAFVDFFFQPHFNKPWNLLNSVALKAL